ncbi:hypothetical protein ACGLWX_09725 [Halomonas sp. HMF6819]|uniref:hypothetical protein n=1 Tax=Halomonas sp. HMF6819 TaxID=3373085 RepID=UPI00378B3ABD
MGTEYTRSVTIAAPDGHLYDANQLALCAGEFAADDRTFTILDQQRDGHLYSTVSTVVKPVFEKLAAGELVAPAHAPNVDLEAARRAQARLVINGGPASPDTIAVIIGDRFDRPAGQRAALELEPVPTELPG